MSTDEMRSTDLAEELAACMRDLTEAQRIAKLGLWRWNLTTNAFTWSEELYRMAGRDPQTFHVDLESTFACIHSEDREQTFERLQRVVTDKRSYDHEYRVITAHGDLLHVWSSARPVVSAAGEVVEVRGVCQDVTGRIRDQRALRESEDHYRHAVELNPQMIWTADPGGNILEVSPRWTEMVGMTEQASAGKGWADALHPEDWHKTIAAWSACLAAGEPVDLEFRVRLKDAAYRWMRARAAPRRGADGSIIRWYGALEDIQDCKLAEEALRDSEEFSRNVLESTPDGIKVLDLDGRIVFANRASIHKLSAVGASAIHGKVWTAFWPGNQQPKLIAAMEAAKAGHTHRFTGSCLNSSGKLDWWEVLASPICDADGQVQRLLVISRDITDAKLARDETEAVGARLAYVLESTTDNVVVIDHGWRITFLNQRTARLIGQDGTLAVGRHLWDVLPGQAGSQFDRCCQLAMDRQTPMTFEEFSLHLGLWLEVHAYPTPSGLSIFFRDITEARRAREEIAHLAHHEPLTGLPNRKRFTQQLAEAFSQADGAEVAVFILDLDKFKEVNDTLGHLVGDALLQQIAGRLRSIVQEAGILARLGGDEFAVIQAVSASGIDPADLAGRLIRALKEPFDINGHLIRTGVSVGIAVARRSGQEPDHVFKCADIALYQAKANGRGVYCFYEPRLSERLQTRQAMKQDLATALENGELRVVYQPLIDLLTNRICSFEALLRWHHPSKGMVSPADFIPLAEETGLIIPMGEWVLAQACRDAAVWPDDVSVAINLSPVQFTSRSLPLRVTRTLAEAGLKPDRLELEITESVLLQDSEANLALLHQIRSLGVHVALDDFGTGFSSLSYLRTFPFDKIKIDRSFVGDIGRAKPSEAIIRAVTDLGRILGMTTTAEGVETREQLDWLRGEGAHQAQGYLISKPVTVDETLRLLNQQIGDATAA